jgi:hypothetical protein
MSTTTTTATEQPALQLVDLEQKPAHLPMAQPVPTRQLSVVEYAMQNGATASEVRALVELQIQMDNHKLAMQKHQDEREREQRIEAARNAYAAAIAAFKAEGVKVIRSKTITDGPLKGKKHADVFGVVDAATEALSKHGLSATWETLQDDKDWIKIACRIKHVAGHSESVAFGGPVDTGPGRNAIQARKSTVSYLNRITMELALGLAEADEDDDGRGGDDGADDQVLDAFRAAALNGTKALRAHYDKNTPTEEFWSKNQRALKQAAAKADQEQGAR